jgi:hypothetical protein
MMKGVQVCDSAMKNEKKNEKKETRRKGLKRRTS